MKKHQEMWKCDYGRYIEDGTRSMLISRLIAETKGECFTAKYFANLKASVLSIADRLVTILQDCGMVTVIKSNQDEWLSVFGEKDDQQVLLIVGSDERRGDAPTPYAIDDDADTAGLTLKVGLFSVTIVGDRKIIQFMLSKLEETFKDERFAQIKWWYLDEREGTTYKTLYLENPNTTLRPEFYPGVKNPNDYITEYLNSDAVILLMAGPPGTGKTTFLRNMIYQHKLTAAVVYDETLMSKDAVFQSFLFSKSDDILIIEDADTILASRDMGKNKLMSRFLNVSDGLIKLPNKKLVFTTNIDDFGRIDNALMRPGRCFDVMHTRALNADEAIAAAHAAKLPIPIDRREYTIAELFNRGGKTATRRIGFGS